MHIYERCRMLVVQLVLLIVVVVSITNRHYHDRPLRYEPLMPALRKLFARFCELRNNKTLSRAEVESKLAELIRLRGSERLKYTFDDFKQAREKREREFWKRRDAAALQLSPAAQLVNTSIRNIRTNTSISYLAECEALNAVKRTATPAIQREMRLRTEDCREFLSPVRPQWSRNRCRVDTTSPIYMGVAEPRFD